jgi:4-hydroxy-tetrahydrodipicolinate reductase
MGAETVRAISAADDLQLVAGFDPLATEGAVECDGQSLAPAFANLEEAIERGRPEVLVDFTTPTAVEATIRTALPLGIDCVIGTTGLTQQRYEELAELALPGTTLFHAPNFTIGAVLMMSFARKAAPFFADTEVIEFHHNGKADAPSGTALSTALQMASARAEAGIESKAPGSETELSGRAGARGTQVEGVFVHSVRSNGFVAHQEVILGSTGETLTIRHDSIDRIAYMPGILLAIRAVGDRSGLIVGLEELMGL